ncbi:hypothetical protein A2165_02035 [Candidatus Curtissbacteria bacterium RBG_13_40_7]|uniref:Uncharacterized protein n=1 Tax=Candidatus Curtissbacteria bacterium RBG_13_40_7 TaxID=1797706 RepID=A0A1F5FZA6_9BACT|nr:MAG: hypothetical protein A2165_02035 [Candidatus Curtissbacteria bacterium RBG_13_40_7]
MKKIIIKLALFSTLFISTTHQTQARLDIPDFPAGHNILFYARFPRTSTFIADLISAFLPAILAIAGFLTVIFIVISGIQFITSSGNPEAAAGARGRLTFALVGFAVIILAFAITQIVDRIFLGSGVAPP